MTTTTMTAKKGTICLNRAEAFKSASKNEKNLMNQCRAIDWVGFYCLERPNYTASMLLLLLVAVAVVADSVLYARIFNHWFCRWVHTSNLYVVDMVNVHSENNTDNDNCRGISIAFRRYEKKPQTRTITAPTRQDEERRGEASPPNECEWKTAYGRENKQRTQRFNRFFSHSLVRSPACFFGHVHSSVHSKVHIHVYQRVCRISDVSILHRWSVFM